MRIRARAVRRCGELLKEIERGYGKNQNISGGTPTNVLKKNLRLSNLKVLHPYMKAISPISCILISVLNIASIARAERTPPTEVPSIKTANAVISAPHHRQGEKSPTAGVLEAHHPTTKALLWRIQVYDPVDKTAEEDPLIFVESLSFDQRHNLVILSDEHGRVFVVDIESRKTTQIEIGSEQEGADQPATAPESKLEGDSKPQTESEGRSQ